MFGAGISVYGCGVVAPRARTHQRSPASSEPSQGGAGVRGLKALEAFAAEMWMKESALSPSEAFAGSFLVGKAAFDFSHYRDPILRLANEKRFSQLQKSAGECVQFAVGATLDAIECCPGLQEAITSNRERVATIIGTGLADMGSIVTARDELEKATFAWNSFWGRSAALEALAHGDDLPEGLVHPDRCSSEYEAWQAKCALYQYFADRNPEQHEFLKSYQDIENRTLGGADASLINQLKAKATDRAALRKRTGAPPPPWESVSPNVLWNIPNLSAAQVSMLLATHGLTFGVSAACSTFALSVRLGLEELRSGRADVAIVGATDANPRPEVLAAFQGARVGAFGDRVVQPMTELRGTHLAGGACTWILCRDEWAERNGLRSLGVRVCSAAVTSDGEHVITPSADGPTRAIEAAFLEAGVQPAGVQSWDLHSTGTPGDVQELDHVKRFAAADSVLTARKGHFGHGMAACGGWELTAQLFAPRFEPSQVLAKGSGERTGYFIIPPSGIDHNALAPAVLARGLTILTGEEGRVAAVSEPETRRPALRCAKLSMGVGGVSSCVVCERFAEW